MLYGDSPETSHRTAQDFKPVDDPKQKFEEVYEEDLSVKKLEKSSAVSATVL